MKECTMWRKILLILFFVLMALVVVLLVVRSTPITDLLGRFHIYIDEEYQCQEDFFQYHFYKNDVGVTDTAYFMSMCMPASNNEQNIYHVLLSSSYCKVNNVVRNAESDISKLLQNPNPLVLRNDTFCFKDKNKVKKFYAELTKNNPYGLKCLRHKNVNYIDAAVINVETYLKGEKRIFTMLLSKHSKKRYNKIQGIVIKILLESGLLSMQQLKDYLGYSINVSDKFELIRAE